MIKTKNKLFFLFLKNFKKIFNYLVKNDENSNETLHQNQKPSKCDISNVSFSDEAHELNDPQNLGINNKQNYVYQNRDQLIHKLKDSNSNNPFSKNYKPNQAQYQKFINNNNNNNNANLSSNSNTINDFNFNSDQFQSNNNSKLRSGGPNKIMCVIKGGNGSNSENSQNHFFSKMLNNNQKNVNPDFTSFDPSIINSINYANNNKVYKINIDKLQREKFEQELRMLDCDDLNNSGDSEYRQGSNTNRELSLNSNKFYYDYAYNKKINNNNNPNNDQRNFKSGKNSKYEDNPMSSRVKPDRNTRNSIWNLFS